MNSFFQYIRIFRDHKAVNVADIFEITPMKIVYIGGGFPSNSVQNRPIFQEISRTIRMGIHNFRKRIANNNEISFITESGRCLVSDATTVGTHIYTRNHEL